MLNKDNHVENDKIMIKEAKSKNKIKTKKSFNKKIILCSLSIIIFSILASFFIKRSYAKLSELNITYQERSNINYKVFLKKNDFYESDYLGKNMVYVASLIDKIDIDYSYIFNIDRKSNIDFTYDVVGKLIITNKNNEKVFFEKEYVLSKEEQDSMVDDKVHTITKSVSIDYGEYNSLANKFRTKYGVDTNSKLVVYLNIHEKNQSNNSFSMDNTNNMFLSIPLSERAIDITMDYNDVNKKSKLIRNEQFVITNYIYVVLGGLFTILSIVNIIKYIRLLFSIRIKKSKYDKYINKLLREYDRLIVETTTAPGHISKKNVVEITKFQELLDVRDNLKLPIKYYAVEEDKESYFYINHEEELYLYKVSLQDFEKDK